MHGEHLQHVVRAFYRPAGDIPSSTAHKNAAQSRLEPSRNVSNQTDASGRHICRSQTTCGQFGALTSLQTGPVRYDTSCCLGNDTAADSHHLEPCGVPGFHTVLNSDREVCCKLADTLELLFLVSRPDIISRQAASVGSLVARYSHVTRIFVLLYFVHVQHMATPSTHVSKASNGLRNWAHFQRRQN